MLFRLPDPTQAGVRMGFKPGTIFIVYPAAISMWQIVRNVGGTIQMQTDELKTPTGAVASISLHINQVGVRRSAGAIGWHNERLLVEDEICYLTGKLLGFEQKITEAPHHLTPPINIYGFMVFDKVRGWNTQFLNALFLQPTKTQPPKPGSPTYVFKHLSALQ